MKIDTSLTTKRGKRERRRRRRRFGPKSSSSPPLFLVCAFAIFALVLIATIYMNLFISSNMPTSDTNRGRALRIVSRTQEDDDVTLCDSKDPCHCKRDRFTCVCISSLSESMEDCVESGCYWDDTKESCDSCSRVHCHGCKTKDDCVDAADFESVCEWKSGRCVGMCSSLHCGSCATRSSCTSHSLCDWNPLARMCVPGCGAHTCDGCDSKTSCLAPGHRCAWDEAQSVCTGACRPNALPNGGGCWTCATKRLCNAARGPSSSATAATVEASSSSSTSWWWSSSSPCKWDDALDICESRSEDSNPLGVQEGDVVNPFMNPAFASAVAGTIVIEGTQWEDLWQLEDFEQVSGHLIVRDNPKLATIELTSMGWVGGDVEFVNNPVLRTVDMGEGAVVNGCVRVWNCPKLETLGGLKGVPKCGGGVGQEGAVV